MNYLLDVVNTYRVDNEQEALKLREELNQIPYSMLINFSYSLKEVKSKGEIVDSYCLVKAKLQFNDVKEPDKDIKPQYQYE